MDSSILATVTGYHEEREIEALRGDGDRIKELRPVPGSERRSLVLTFRSGKTLEVGLSSDDFERFIKAISEAPPAPSGT